MSPPLLAPRLALAAAALAASLLHAPQALACAVCQCGDPTLTTMGAEQPFAGRLRLSLDTVARTDQIGTPMVDELSLRELSSLLGVSWAPTARLQLSAQLPLVAREVTWVDLSRDRSFSPGDLEVRARALVWADRDSRPRHLVFASAGLKAPTAPQQRDVSGAPLLPEAQAGTGSVDAIAGAAWLYLNDPISAWVSAQGRYAFGGWGGMSISPTLLTSAALQWQPGARLGLRATVDTRAGAVVRWDGEVDPNTGGLVAFAGADVLFSPAEDLILKLGGAWPALQLLDGDHREGPRVGLGVVYDF